MLLKNMKNEILTAQILFFLQLAYVFGHLYVLSDEVQSHTVLGPSGNYHIRVLFCWNTWGIR